MIQIKWELLLWHYILGRGFKYLKKIEAKAKIKSGEIKVIIDVRTSLEYNLGH